MSGLVLVIEDEVDLATTLEYNLRSEGFQVRVAHTGRQGIAAATTDPLPDVIVLDLDAARSLGHRDLPAAARGRSHARHPGDHVHGEGRGDRSRRRLRGRRR